MNHPYTFWTLIALPVIPMLIRLTSGDPKAVNQILHPSDEFAARFMIMSMMIAPLMMLVKTASWPWWLMKRRRYLGVAAFIYSLLHTVLYLLDKGAVALTGTEKFQILYLDRLAGVSHLCDACHHLNLWLGARDGAKLVNLAALCLWGRGFDAAALGGFA